MMKDQMMTITYEKKSGNLCCAFRQGRASLFEQCSKTRAEESRLEAELQEERRRMSRMKSMMQDTAVTLKYVLMVKQKES